LLIAGTRATGNLKGQQQFDSPPLNEAGGLPLGGSMKDYIFILMRENDLLRLKVENARLAFELAKEELDILNDKIKYLTEDEDNGIPNGERNS
jgi:hypothetical protein